MVPSSSSASNRDAKEKMDNKDPSEEEESSEEGESLSEENLAKSVNVNTGITFPKSNEKRDKPVMLPSLKEQRIKNYMDKIGSSGVQVTISSTNDKAKGNEPLTDSKEDSAPKSSELKEKADKKKSSKTRNSMKNIKDKKGEDSKNLKGDTEDLDLSNNPPEGYQKIDDKKKSSKTRDSMKNVTGKKGEDSKKSKSDTVDFDLSNNPPEGYQKIDDKKKSSKTRDSMKNVTGKKGEDSKKLKGTQKTLTSATILLKVMRRLMTKSSRLYMKVNIVQIIWCMAFCFVFPSSLSSLICPSIHSPSYLEVYCISTLYIP